MKNKDLIILSLVTTFYFVSVAMGQSIASLYLFITLLIPSFYIFQGIVAGRGLSLLSLSLQAILVSFINPGYGIIVFFLVVFSAIMIEMIKRNKVYGSTLAVGALVVFIFIFALFSMSGALDLINSPEYKAGFIDETKFLLTEDIGISLEDFKKAVKVIFETVLVLLPSIMIISSFIISGINYYISIGLLRKKFPKDVRFKNEFSQFKLPSNFMMGVIFILAFALVLKFSKIPYYQQFMGNIITLAEGALMWQGVAFFSYLMKKRGVFTIWRIIILGLAILIPLTSMFLPFMGIIEFIFKFRDRDSKDKELL